MAKRGRPSKFNQKVADLICERLSEGESLRAICKDEGMPKISTVLAWTMDMKGSFFAQYARARDIQADVWADEINSIADDSTNDWMMTKDGIKPDKEHINRSRLRIDTRKWICSKLKPKRYGDKLEVDNKSSDRTMSPGVTINLVKNGREPASD